ncbi:TPA: ead/Ea22-like family protein [Escherichia coli]
MTALNKHALREAAEKATPGEWKRMMRNSDELMTTFHGVAIGNVFVELTTGKRDIFDAEFIAAANPSTVLSLLDELEAAEKRIAELEANKCKPVMFIDGDISPADADKLAAVIREFNEETETPAARMARIIRENPHPTNMCDMPAAGIGKGE